LVKAREHLQKHLLGKVFFGDPARQVGAANADDERIEVLHKVSRSDLIALAHAIETASQIKRLVVSHSVIESSYITLCKTPLAAARLPALGGCAGQSAIDPPKAVFFSELHV
jgi:hypothetical protein